MQGDDGRTHHLALTLHGRVLPYSMSIFEAIRRFGSDAPPPPPPPSSRPSTATNSAADDAAANDGASAPPPPPPSLGHRLWSDVYSISYRPLRPEDTAHAGASGLDRHAAPLSSSNGGGGGDSGGWRLAVTPHESEPLLARLAREPPALQSECGSAAPLVRLLWTLLQLETHAASLFAADGAAAAVAAGGADSARFLNRKLNAKLLRQLADPLALCSRALPSWCDALSAGCSLPLLL